MNIRESERRSQALKVWCTIAVTIALPCRLMDIVGVGDDDRDGRWYGHELRSLLVSGNEQNN
jgi:hypothetical protein